jgi:antitoxin (DNA-binding transcriptional repressor) of toxin-antitoxin stability system
MKTATIRDLRYDFSRVEAWIRNGNEIEVTKHGRPIARITPLPKPAARKLVKPDIMAQLKETWGDRTFSAKEVAEMRAADWKAKKGDRLPGHVVSLRALSAAGQFPGGGGAFQNPAGSVARFQSAVV